MKKFFPWLLVGGVLALASCLADKAPLPAPAPPLCDTVGLTYRTDIKPILDRSCATPGCHDAASATVPADNPLYDFATARATSLAGRVVCSIERTGNCSPMPRRQPALPACEVAKIRAWVAAGCPE